MLRAAVVGTTDAAAAEPYIRCEKHRAVTGNDVIPRLSSLSKGYEEVRARDQVYRQVLNELLAQAGYDGTFKERWDDPPEFQVGPATDAMLDADNPLSAVREVLDWTDAIFDNRPVPTVTITQAVYVSEPLKGSKNATFVVTLSSWSRQEVRVQFHVGGGDAAAGEDYLVPPYHEVVFPRYVRSKVINVPVIADDDSNEHVEVFFVTLDSATNAEVDEGPGKLGIGHIRDALRHWHLIGDVMVEGYADVPFETTFSLPRNGGVAAVALPYGVTGRIAATSLAMTVSASGFKLEDMASVRGSGSGSGPIVPTGSGFIVTAPITGSVVATCEDGTSETLQVSGSFTAIGDE